MGRTRHDNAATEAELSCRSPPTHLDHHAAGVVQGDGANLGRVAREAHGKVLQTQGDDLGRGKRSGAVVECRHTALHSVVLRQQRASMLQAPPHKRHGKSPMGMQAFTQTTRERALGGQTCPTSQQTYALTGTHTPAPAHKNCAEFVFHNRQQSQSCTRTPTP